MYLVRTKLHIHIFVSLIAIISSNCDKYGTQPEEDKQAVLDFVSCSRRFIQGSRFRVQSFKMLETGQLRIDSVKDLNEWLWMSDIARQTIEDELDFLRRYPRQGLVSHSQEVDLLIQLLSRELKLWQAYDLFAKTKLQPDDPDKQKRIEKTLSSELSLYKQAADSLQNFYYRKTEELHGWKLGEPLSEKAR